MPERAHYIRQIAQLPVQLCELIAPYSAQELTTAYRPGEWTAAQNVHHVADSHLNSYIRCKLMLTEDHPTLKPYDQDVWAQLPDSLPAQLNGSLDLITGLHARWVNFWEHLPEAAWTRTAYHPENGVVRLEDQLVYYAAHGLGHLHQIAETLRAGGLHVAPHSYLAASPDKGDVQVNLE